MKENGRLEESEGLKCPTCDKMLDGFSGLEESQEGRGPKDGNFTICFYCASIHTYGNNLTKLNACTESDLEKLKLEDVEVWNQLIITQQYIKSRN